MSTLPPNLAGAILQSHLAQRQVSNVRDQEEAQKTYAERQQRLATDQKDTSIEATDTDTQVHADAEGGGSQGRAFSEPESADEASLEGQDEHAAPPDGSTGRHIDLEA